MSLVIYVQTLPVLLHVDITPVSMITIYHLLPHHGLQDRKIVNFLNSSTFREITLHLHMNLIFILLQIFG